MSKAALKINLSQPAVSHKLNKLRDEWQDPLFVRSGTGLMPTIKADELAAEIKQALCDIDGIYGKIDSSNFFNQSAKVYLYSTDWVEYFLLPKLLPKVHEKAPKVQIITRNTQGQLPISDLEAGMCDIAIAGFFQNLPAKLYQQQLSQENFVVLRSLNHPILGGHSITLDDYLACDHVVTTLTGDLNGIVDQALKTLGKERRISAGVSSFLAAPHLVKDSQYTLTCLKSVAEYACAVDSELTFSDCPLGLPAVYFQQIFHARTKNSPLHQWIRGQIKQIFT